MGAKGWRWLFMGLAVALAGCTPRPALRRTLVTDQFGPDAALADVGARLARTGWCVGAASTERYRHYYKCDGTAPMGVTFEYVAGRMASVTLHVLATRPRDEEAARRLWPLPARVARSVDRGDVDAMGLPVPVVAFAGWHHGYGPERQVPANAWSVFEALGVELERRYGAPSLVAGDPYWRFWRVSAHELCELRIAWGGLVVEEAHYFLDGVPLVAQLPMSSSDPSWPSGPKE